MTGVLGGLGAGNLGAAAAGGMAPYIANKIKQATSKVVDGQEQTNVLANTMAHAVAGAVLAQLAGNNATAGAAGAAGGELMARAILSSMYPGKQASELTQEEKQVVSALGQLAAQLSAGVASGSVEGGIQGAVAGKNAVENNALSFGTGMNSYGAAVKSWNQYAEVNGLTPEQKQAGLNRIAVGEGPSWGTEYKVKPNGKVEVSGGVGLALKGGSEINNDYLSISSGYTKEFGIKAGASIGIDFGPYFPGLFGDLNRDYSTSIGFGPGSVGMSGGKDGIGISFSIGPIIGFTGSATGSHDEKLDLNGDSTKEIYHYDFK